MPIKNEKGEVVLFLVSHKDITKSKTSKSDGQFRGEYNIVIKNTEVHVLVILLYGLFIFHSLIYAVNPGRK